MTTEFRATPQDLADAVRQGLTGGVETILTALEQMPEHMSAHEAAACLRELQPTFDGCLIHEFEQWAAAQ